MITAGDVQQYGVFIFIPLMAGIIVFLYKQGTKLQDKYDAMQNQRIEDAKETRDKISEPLSKIASQQEILAKQYDILINESRRG